MKKKAVYWTLLFIGATLEVLGPTAVIFGALINHAWLLIGGVAFLWAGYCMVDGDLKVNQ